MQRISLRQLHHPLWC